ncbi:amino acid ABC transporter permease [Saccharospirillum mangrovi]|uniref:amino acid ABC transporter permease n=1 Tax=Saccharospirillum mangrovi TaxID=2161747 RepID=UPI000D34A6C9|nr:amino acid ABC transporter permease [Saccharospirillum mangrovi]
MAPKHPSDTARPLMALLYDKTVRSIIYQVLVFGGVFFLGWYLVSNVQTNLDEQNIATGFGFLDREAAFGISESVISYSPQDNYGRALAVGILNTIKVSLTGIILATIIGTLIGIGLVSKNWLVRFIGKSYIDLFRNVPLLLQLFFWYALITNGLPGVRQALNPLPGTFLTNRGLYIPIPADNPAWFWVFIAFVVGIIGSFVLRRWSFKRLEATGQVFPHLSVGLGIIVGLPILTWLLFGAPVEMNVPALQGFNFKGGLNMSPEFFTLLLGLTVYTATYIAEVVRSGIQSVPKGQSEASTSLGLKPSWTMRLIILPQALRVIIPPLTNQYLNLTKNSSLAVAIGYPELVSISNTTMNQTGQAVEGVAIFMTVYLGISLLISVFMNWYNKRMALVER